MRAGLAQLRALVALRWRMIRSPDARRGLGALAALVPLAILGGVVGGQLAPESARLDAGVAAPTIYLAFLVLSIVSPLTAGGGNELYPAEQLVAFPIRPETQYLTGVAVLPINLAWVSQLVAISAATAFFVPRRPGSLLGVVTVLAYVGVCATLGQLLSWTVAGLRQTRTGRIGVWTVAGAVGAAAVVVARAGRLDDVLDQSPTIDVAVGAAAGGIGNYPRWAVTTGALVAIALATAAAGRAVCGWALRRPGDAGTFREGRVVRVRPIRRSAFAQLRAVDRASVWRSPSLRRGALVLGLLPGAATFALGVDWSTVLLLPGLVASGAALLFGVNAFCLDSGGAVWLATLPQDPRLALRAKAWVLTETTVVCVLLAVAGAVLRAKGAPTPAQLAGLAGAGVATIASVVGTSLRLSVERPHRADLRGRRDTPAPPGTMAVYSARMAAQTTFAGLFVAGAAATGHVPATLLVSASIALLGLRSAAAAARQWTDARRRAYVAVTVAAG